MFTVKEKNVVWWWNKRVRGYKLHGFQGAFAYEIQIGTFVFQWFYSQPHINNNGGRRLRVWRDSFGKE